MAMKINEKNLVTYSITRDHIDKEGYLLKRGEINKAFQRRWFVLKGNLLFYFERKGDKEPIGVIILEGFSTELAESEEYFAFKLIFGGCRSYVLAAESQESLESWMKHISRASYDYLKLVVAELQKQLEEAEYSEGTEGCVILSPVSLSAQSYMKRENPFNKREEDCSFSDLWRCNESLRNATSLLSRDSVVGNEIVGVNSSLPPSVPFRPAPPPPTFKNSTTKQPLRKKFAQLHDEFGASILKDKESHRATNLSVRSENSIDGLCSVIASQNLIDL